MHRTWGSRPGTPAPPGADRSPAGKTTITDIVRRPRPVRSPARQEISMTRKIRTARSRTSGENLFVLAMTPILSRNGASGKLGAVHYIEIGPRGRSGGTPTSSCFRTRGPGSRPGW